jgi:hypothetical protein
MTDIPRVSDCVARLDHAIATAGSERDRILLQVYKAHWWGEVTSDVEAIMATLPPDGVSYHFDGLSLTRALPIQIGDLGVIRGMYQSVADLGLPIAGAFFDERFAFADWGLTIEVTQSAIYPGRFLASYPKPLDPEQLYLTQWRMVGVHPIDVGRRLMLGENVYNGAPLRVEPVDRAAIEVMLS